MKIPFKKTIGFLTLLCFLFEQYSWAIPPGSIQMNFSSEIPIAKSFEIPAELAQVETIYTAPQNENKSKVIFYIQNIHAHRQAQIQIQKIADYLSKKYGVKDLFLEGAAEDLNPGEVQIFKDPKLNQKYAEILAEKGDLTGAEMVLLEDRKSVV